MSKVRDVVYVVKSQDGKPRYINIGAMFISADGKESIKLDSIPVGFTGWLNLYQLRERGQKTESQRQDDGQPFDDTIPFSRVGA